MRTSPNAVRSVHDLPPQLANCRAHWLSWGGGDDPGADLTVHRSGVSHPMLNGVTRVRGRDLGDAVEEVLGMLDGLPFFWWVGADSGPAVADFLLGRGAAEVATFPVMALSLNEIPGLPAPAGFRATVASSAADVRTYVETYAESLEVGPAEVARTAAGELNRSDRHEEVTRFVGWSGDRPVGTAELSVSNGVAGIYTVCTVPGMRRRGFATALSIAAMRAAQERGLRVCTLSASADGERLYRRMGLRTVGRYRLFVL